MVGCAGDSTPEDEAVDAPQTTTTQSPEASAQLTDEALYDARCGMCHGLKRNEDWAAKSWYDPASWRVIVLRMKDANLCPMTDEEAERIIKYMEGIFPKQAEEQSAADTESAGEE